MPTTLQSTYSLACAFLTELSPKSPEASYWRERTLSDCPESEVSFIPKPGWAYKESVAIESEPHALRAVIPCVAYSASTVAFMHFEKNATLIKLAELRAVWLHLHVAILLAVETEMFAPQALATMRIVPCISGLEKQPPAVFPLAHAALRWNADHLYADLPF